VQNLLTSSALFKNIKIKVHRTIILPAVFHECEILSLTLREERRLCLLEDRELRITFDEVTGDWKKLHKNELNDLYSSPNIIRCSNRE
jgi:hypothetical protein